MVSVDVKSLFTSIPSEYTTDIIIKHFLKIMKLRNIHKIHIQIGCIAIGSPLKPVIANIFMVELENSLVPKL